MNSGQGTTISLAAAVQVEASKQRPGRPSSRQPPHHQNPHPVQMPLDNLSNLRLNTNTGSLSSSSSSSSFRGNSGQFFAMYNPGFDPAVRNSSSSSFGYGVSPNIHDDINASGSAFSQNSSCFSAIDTNPGMFTNTSDIIHTPIPAEAPSDVNIHVVPPVPMSFYDNDNDGDGDGDEDDEDDSYTQVSPVTVDNSPHYGNIGAAGVQPFVDVKVALPQVRREEEVADGEVDEEVCEVVKFPVPLSEKDALKVFARTKFVGLRAAVEDRGNVLKEGGEKYKTVHRAKALLDAGNSAMEGLRPDPRTLVAALKISKAMLEAKNLLQKENMQQQQSRDTVPSFKYKKDGLARLEQNIAHLGSVENKY